MGANLQNLRLFLWNINLLLNKLVFYENPLYRSPVQGILILAGLRTDVCDPYFVQFTLMECKSREFGPMKISNSPGSQSYFSSLL